MNAGRDKFESQLLNYIKDAEQEYQELEQKQAELNSRIATVKETLDSLRKALQFHLRRTGKVEEKLEAKLNGVTSVREACHILLQEQGEMGKEQLVKALQASGFKFTANKPVRAVHFAMVGNRYVSITENGTYKWAGNKIKVSVLTIPKAVVQFFVQRNNSPASISEVLSGIKKLGVRTTTKDLEGSVEMELIYYGKTEKTEDGKYYLKPSIFEAAKTGQS